MEDFKKWLNADIKIPINSRKVVLKFNDKENYEAIVENYDCESIDEFLTVRMSTQEFGALIQVYMGSITYWN